jgi:uncharacterized protein (TIGR03435 family)
MADWNTQSTIPRNRQSTIINQPAAINLQSAICNHRFLLRSAGAPARVADADGHDPSLFPALREQLGLTLEDARAPVQVMVIDAVDRPVE